MNSDNDIKAVADTDGLLLFRSTSNADKSHISEKDVIVTAQLSGLFFQTCKGSFSHETLVCYRRNLFHIRGTIILPSEPEDLARQLGISSQVVDLIATLSATESNLQSQTDLVSVPKGIAAGSTASPSSNSPDPIVVPYQANGRGSEPISFAWSRLHFRTATIKNGRRKDKSGDQFFVTKIRICLRLEDASELVLTELQSAPIMVRGRSPRNFGTSKGAVKAAKDVTHEEQQLREPTIEKGTEAMLATPLSSEQTLSAKNDMQRDMFLDPQDQGTWHEFDTPAIDSLALGETSIDFDNGATGFANAHTDYFADFGTEYEGLWDFSMIDGASHEAVESENSSTIGPPSAVLHDASISTSSRYNRTEQSTVSAGKQREEKGFSYEYIPLALEDRTAPVQGVYVSIRPCEKPPNCDDPNPVTATTCCPPQDNFAKTESREQQAVLWRAIGD